MDRRIKVAVVGVGRFGRHHARVYHELPEAELVGVYDLDPARAAEVAKLYHPRASPGCIAVGETREEVVQLVHEAIDLHIESLRREDQDSVGSQSLVSNLSLAGDGRTR